VRDFERWRPRTPRRQYLTGETHLYLGRQFRLQIKQSETPDVRLIGDRLVPRRRSRTASFIVGRFYSIGMALKRIGFSQRV
jgi:hypothetical protein